MSVKFVKIETNGDMYINGSHDVEHDDAIIAEARQLIADKFIVESTEEIGLFATKERLNRDSYRKWHRKWLDSKK